MKVRKWAVVAKTFFTCPKCKEVVQLDLAYPDMSAIGCNCSCGQKIGFAKTNESEVKCLPGGK